MSEPNRADWEAGREAAIKAAQHYEKHDDRCNLFDRCVCGDLAGQIVDAIRDLQPPSRPPVAAGEPGQCMARFMDGPVEKTCHRWKHEDTNHSPYLESRLFQPPATDATAVLHEMRVALYEDGWDSVGSPVDRLRLRLRGAKAKSQPPGEGEMTEEESARAEYIAKHGGDAPPPPSEPGEREINEYEAETLARVILSSYGTSSPGQRNLARAYLATRAESGQTLRDRDENSHQVADEYAARRAAESREAALREALEEYRSAAIGFACAVRQDSGLAYPWPALNIAEESYAALAPAPPEKEPK